MRYCQFPNNAPCRFISPRLHFISPFYVGVLYLKIKTCFCLSQINPSKKIQWMIRELHSRSKFVIQPPDFLLIMISSVEHVLKATDYTFPHTKIFREAYHHTGFTLAI